MSINEYSDEVDEQKNTLTSIFSLVWRCWPYYQPMVRHLIAWVALSAISGAVLLGCSFVANDLIENKILLGQKLQPLQAKFLWLDETYVGSSSDIKSLLSDEQRRDVRFGLVVWAVLLVILFLVSSAFIVYYMVWIFQQINQKLRIEMLTRAEHLSLKYHTQSRTGDAIYRVYQDSASITRVLQYLIISPLRIIAWLVFSVIVLSFFSPWFILIVLGAAIPVIFLSRHLIPKVRDAAARSRELNSDLTSRIQEILAALKVIKAGGAEKRMMAKFQKDSQGALNAAYEMRLNIALMTMGVAVIGFSALLIAEYFMATWAMTKKATYLGAAIALVGFSAWNLGAFKSASSHGAASSGQIIELVFIWGIIQDILIGLRRAFFLLDLEPEVKESDSPVALPEKVERVVFNEVVFAYQSAEPILRGINLKAEAGTITAIVGSTGSGKSTLMSLLLRLYDPDAGSISINAINLRELDITNLRSKVAIALQQNVLFSMTVEDNIRYGQGNVGRSDVIEAAKVACADNFIETMPNGYDTELGERGGKLSTGQRQRLSIARAIIRNTPILILDEPTASLDAETEHNVIKNLAEWGGNRIIFILTHRLSTIRHADQIALLEHGIITELGHHDELLTKNGAYSRFVKAEQGS